MATQTVRLAQGKSTPYDEFNMPIPRETFPVKKPILQMIRSGSTGTALQQHLHALMKKRWLRVAGIVIAVFLVLLIALQFLINVNSFSKSPYITAKSLEVVVELALAFSAAALMPLIFSTQSNVTRIALNEPLITLLKALNGVWKFSNLSTTGVAIGKAMARHTGGFQTLAETEVVNLRLVITGAGTISPAGEMVATLTALRKRTGP